VGGRPACDRQRYAAAASWVLVAVAVILLWAPVLLRWVANLRGSIASFREGLHGK